MIETTTRTDQSSTALRSAGDRSRATPRRLLSAGVVAGPLFLAVGLAQAATRDGFDLGRHALSQLALGPLGFVQIGTFLATGALLVVAARGLRRAMSGVGATWGPRLVAVFGIGMLIAGVFVADPAFGYPVGAPAGPGDVSWHGALHGVGFAVAMLGWVSACVVLTRWFAARGERGWAAGCLAALAAAAVLGAAPFAGFGVRIVLVSAVQFAVVAAVSLRVARSLR